MRSLDLMVQMAHCVSRDPIHPFPNEETWGHGHPERSWQVSTSLRSGCVVSQAYHLGMQTDWTKHLFLRHISPTAQSSPLLTLQTWPPGLGLPLKHMPLQAAPVQHISDRLTSSTVPQLLWTISHLSATCTNLPKGQIPHLVEGKHIVALTYQCLEVSNKCETLFWKEWWQSMN